MQEQSSPDAGRLSDGATSESLCHAQRKLLRAETIALRAPIGAPPGGNEEEHAQEPASVLPHAHAHTETC
jgi:hypothetical protein